MPYGHPIDTKALQAYPNDLKNHFSSIKKRHTKLF